MIRDLSETLKAILEDDSLPEPLRSAAIAFERPTDPYSPGQRTVNVFLYDIRENVELRSNEPRLERQNGQTIMHRPPLRVACSYLVTAWPVGGEELHLQEHELLSQVLQVLSGHPTIPENFLQGRLKTQEPPLPMVTALVDPQKNLSEFWTAIGNKLRPSLTVTVTIAMEVLAPATAPMVITEQVRFGERLSPEEEKIRPQTQAEFFSINGRVTEVHSGTAQGGAAGPPPTITLANSATAIDDFYNGMHLETTAGTGSGQVRTIIHYVGATRVATVDLPWTTVPDNTSAYAVNAPVAGATVRLVELDRATKTGADGRYSIGTIPRPGPYTLRVQKNDAAGQEVSITVPAPKESNYDVQLV
jgi:hypothetical protein